MVSLATRIIPVTENFRLHIYHICLIIQLNNYIAA